jgi:hypothetical protein
LLCPVPKASWCGSFPIGIKCERRGAKRFGVRRLDAALLFLRKLIPRHQRQSSSPPTSSVLLQAAVRGVIPNKCERRCAKRFGVRRLDAALLFLRKPIPRHQPPSSSPPMSSVLLQAAVRGVIPNKCERRCAKRSGVRRLDAALLFLRKPIPRHQPPSSSPPMSSVLLQAAVRGVIPNKCKPRGAKRFGVRRLDAALLFLRKPIPRHQTPSSSPPTSSVLPQTAVRGVISKRRRAAALQSASHIHIRYLSS